MDENAQKKTRSLRYSFTEGVFAAGMIGFTQEYFTPFILLLGASARHIGMLSALPNLFASIVQAKAADLAERFQSRKKVVTTFVLLQGLMLVPVALISFWHAAHPFGFIALVVAFTSCGAIAVPTWGSMMSDLVAEKRRGAYFGWRNRTLGVIIVSATFLAGLILHVMHRVNVMYGFFIIFGCACVFRLLSWYFMNKMYEPPLEYRPEHCFTLYDFFARIKESNFAKFVLFVALMSFSVNLASPFFAVLMLKDLGFGYLLYALISITATITIYLTMSRWGRHADVTGNLKVIRFTAPLIGIIPLPWIMSREPAVLIAAQVFSGFIWAGFNLCTSNFIYDAVTPEKRTRCIAYFNLTNGIALSCGALVGGLLLPLLPPLFGFNILTLLLISSMLRLVVGVTLPMILKEVRPVERIKSNDLFFSMIGVRPILGIERKAIPYQFE